MSASGSSDPRLSRADTRANPHTHLLVGAIEASRLSPGAGLHGTQHFGGTALSAKRQRRGSGRLLGLFELVAAIKYHDDGSVEEYRVRVTGSTMAGESPDGFSAGDDPPFYFGSLASGDFIAYAKFTFTEATGAITERKMVKLSDAPGPTAGVKYERIGSFTVDTGEKTITVHNDRFGPVLAEPCRQWGESTVKFALLVT